ncbi:GspH/FimT family pseudopilin [Pseudomonas sp. Marseille-QA0892]
MNRRSASGFTIVELMIVVFLLGIVAAIAIPGFTQLINNNRAQSAANELASLLQFTRTSALTHRMTITACYASKDRVWSVRRSCDDNGALRTLELPAGVNSAVAKDEIAFRYNGSVASQDIVLCHGSDAANGYTLHLLPTGMVQLPPRGKTPDDKDMAKCSL